MDPAREPDRPGTKQARSLDQQRGMAGTLPQEATARGVFCSIMYFVEEAVASDRA